MNQYIYERSKKPDIFWNVGTKIAHISTTFVANFFKIWTFKASNRSLKEITTTALKKTNATTNYEQKYFDIQQNKPCSFTIFV